jgi:cephalosporin-C deacetylase-like acetyl esterase
MLLPVPLFLAATVVPVSLSAEGELDKIPAVANVLKEKPGSMLLDYFRDSAESLSAGHPVPATLDEWKQRRGELRRRLWKSLGNFPLDKRPALNARLTGTRAYDGYTVEKIVYESLPGLFVTALVYVPSRVTGRVPAVICVNGHWKGAKREPLIQKRCIMLARMGVIAFCQDVIGTGERAAFGGSPPVTYHGFYRGAAPRIVDRSLLGYIAYECLRAFDYLESRPDVDAKRIICTGASGGGKQSMFFPALDERLAGGVPVCYISSYEAHIGATACVGEIPTGVLRYTNQWEILGLHAPRPLLCMSASRDVPVFLPKQAFNTLDRTSNRVYQLYGAEKNVRLAEFDSKHDYNKEMRERLYRHVSGQLLGAPDAIISEPDDLPVETAKNLRCGLPSHSETMQSLTYRRARELVGRHSIPRNQAEWNNRKIGMLSRLKNDLLGGFPASSGATQTRVDEFTWKGHRIEYWVIESEPGVLVPALLCLPREASATNRRPAVLVVDEEGKAAAFARGLIERLLASGSVVLAIDYRGAGETANTVPSIGYGPGTPDYNLSNYALLVGRPLMGMRAFDIHCAIDLLAARREVDATKISVAGRGRGAFACLLSAAFDQRIRSVACEEMLTTWVFEEEFVDIGLSYLIPQILTVADVCHLAACLAPRPLLLLNPVDGRRRTLAEQDARALTSFTQSVYALRESAEKLTRKQVDKQQSPVAVVRWLGNELRQPDR